MRFNGRAVNFHLYPIDILHYLAVHFQCGSYAAERVNAVVHGGFRLAGKYIILQQSTQLTIIEILLNKSEQLIRLP